MRVSPRFSSGDRHTSPAIEVVSGSYFAVRFAGFADSVIKTIDRVKELAQEMAAYISPRPSFTRHPLTTQAAAHMVDLVKRASRFDDPS